MSEVFPDELPLDHIEMLSCLLAERAELIDGKLFLSGGGFDRIQARLPLRLEASLAVVLSVLAVVLSVPWTRLEEPYELTAEIADADGGIWGKRIRAQMESYAGPDYRPGLPLTVPLVIPVRAELSQPGRYAINCQVDARTTQRVAFELVAATG